MNIIKEMRLNANMKQDYVAYKCRVSQQEVSNWERGKSVPRYDHLFDLARLFKCTPETILEGLIINE